MVQQKAFSLDRITKSPAVFDMKKLRWVNGQHLRALPESRLAELVQSARRLFCALSAIAARHLPVAALTPLLA